MDYFNPKPNFQRLKKYFNFPNPPDVMEQQYPDGYPIVIDWIYTDEAVKGIEDGFTAILSKYGLSDHYDNLLFLCLGKAQEIEAVLYELHFQYDQRKRTKELAGLLLAFEETDLNQRHGILLKTHREPAKVSDKILIEWVGNTLVKAVIDGNTSATHFQFDIREAFFDSSEKGLQLNKSKLITEASRTLISPIKRVNTLKADFCLYLYKYLVGETTIKTNPDVLMSDAQLNFYFDVLVLLGFLNADNIDSEHKDYMGALLRNRLNVLNP